MTALFDWLVKHAPLLIVFMWGITGIGLLLHQQWMTGTILLMGTVVILYLYLTFFKEI